MHLNCVRFLHGIGQDSLTVLLVPRGRVRHRTQASFEIERRVEGSCNAHITECIGAWTNAEAFEIDAKHSTVEVIIEGKDPSITFANSGSDGQTQIFQRPPSSLF